MLYLDIFSGLSGDMFLGALIDLGVPFPRLEAELRALGVTGYHLHVHRASKSGIEGTKFDVHLEGHADPDHHHHHHPHPHHDSSHSHSHPHPHPHAHDSSGATPPHHATDRTYADIRDLIQRSALNAWVKARAVAVFDRIAKAEGKIHGLPPDRVHFHEVGAIDSIIDVVGACIGLDLLGRPEVVAGPVVEGTGFVRCAHGRMPLPAPATLEIFAARGVTLQQCDEPHELVTPTGAALLAEFATRFEPLRAFKPTRVGYGLGTRDNRTRPNLVRALLGDPVPETPPNAAPNLPPNPPQPATPPDLPTSQPPASADWETDTIAVLETNLDDLSAEILGHFVERALAAGALDVFHTPIQMKKNRPGVLLTILCPTPDADRFARLLLTETSAFGVRQTVAHRRKLRREFRRVPTPFGEITVKIGLLDGAIVQWAPEYESCRQAAAATGADLRQVFQAAARPADPIR